MVREKNNELELRILEVLEEYGFDLEDVGTLFYKEIIRNIVYTLTKCSKKSEIASLKEELMNPYSQFYFDISVNDNLMGLKTFHAFISDAIEEASLKNCKHKLIDHKVQGFSIAMEIARTFDRSKTLKLFKEHTKNSSNHDK